VEDLESFAPSLAITITVFCCIVERDISVFRVINWTDTRLETSACISMPIAGLDIQGEQWEWDSFPSTKKTSESARSD
jgi:hypothetical protein